MRKRGFLVGDYLALGIREGLGGKLDEAGADKAIEEVVEIFPLPGQGEFCV